MTTKYIFGKSEIVSGIEIFPVKLKDYDDFINASVPLYYSKDHFVDEVKEFPLLDLVIFAIQDEALVADLEKTFSIVVKNKVQFFSTNETYGFKLENGLVIDNQNYDEIRSTIMKQNLMFEQKVYKDKLVQDYMNKVFQARAKNSIKMEFEDKISTVSVFTGKHYWDLAEYTIYQLEMDFNRINKFKSYDTGIAARCAGSDVNVEHYAENIDMFKSPYDLSNFTKSTDKVNKLNQTLK